MAVEPGAVLAIIEGTHGQPFDVLGPHLEGGALAVRLFLPDARRAWVTSPDGSVLAEAARVGPAGFFEARLAGRDPSARYRIRFETLAGARVELDDPYAFPSLLSDFDLHLLKEGTHHRIWEKLGAHLTVVRGMAGCHFAVWAPNARRVSVVGDFNTWDGRRHPMRKHVGNGIWELFVPGLVAGENYKYELLPSDGGAPLLKADPYGFWGVVPPETASRVFDLAGYGWGDQEWMERRKGWDCLKSPVSIYEVHLGSWRRRPEEGQRSLSYRELADALGDYVQKTGYTHVELLPITEHPFFGSWGYQPTNFFAPTARYGNPHDLMAFVDGMHRRGIGVILDWVPAHFPADAHGLARFDGTCLYEHADPRKGFHPDWNTLVFNYGRTEVWNFLLSNALFWLEQYHFDGLRVDAVASMLYLDYSRKEGQWVPNTYGGKENLEAVELLKQLNVLVHREHPGVMTIAEESTAWPGVSRPTWLGGLGFSLKWNMGWMHDNLDYFTKDPIFRKYAANKFTFSMIYAYSENFVLALSHDEVVHGKGSLVGKMPGDAWQKLANLRALLTYMIGHPGKKLVFMGSEFGQWAEWNHDSSLDWHLLDLPAHQGVHRLVEDLHRLYRARRSLWERDFSPDGFQWIDCCDSDNSVYSFLRRAEDPEDLLVFACNLTPVPRMDYRVGVPVAGVWAELLNSDAAVYGGSDLGNAGEVRSEPVAWQGFDHSVRLVLPPLAVLVLEPRRLASTKAAEAGPGGAEAVEAKPAAADS